MADRRDPATRDPLWWFAVALCHGRSVAFTGPIPANRALARRICHECPAANVCAWYGMALEAPMGIRSHIYGGLGPQEREDFVRRNGITESVAWDEYRRAREELWEYVRDRPDDEARVRSVSNDRP